MNASLALMEASRGVPLQSHFRVHERVEVDGGGEHSLFTWIGYAEGRLALWEDSSKALPLDPEFIAGVFERYATPVEKIGDITARMLLPDNTSLMHMLFVPQFDVVPKDYLVWVPHEKAPLVELCARLVPPLLHLARVQAEGSL